jgi:hypothetical protein
MNSTGAQIKRARRACLDGSVSPSVSNSDSVARLFYLAGNDRPLDGRGARSFWRLDSPPRTALGDRQIKRVSLRDVMADAVAELCWASFARLRHEAFSIQAIAPVTAEGNDMWLSMLGVETFNCVIRVIEAAHFAFAPLLFGDLESTLYRALDGLASDKHFQHVPLSRTHVKEFLYKCKEIL